MNLQRAPYLSHKDTPMEERVNTILNSANKRQYLIDVLDRLLKETNFYVEVVKKSEKLLEHSKDNYEELCTILSEYVYENMPEEARNIFEREVCKFIDEDVHPVL